jgi:hypothetical protein
MSGNKINASERAIAMADEFDWTKLLDVDGLVNTEQPATPASVLFMITQAQKARLRDLGYSDAVISAMTPEEAQRMLMPRSEDD